MAAGAPAPSCPICYEDVQDRPVLTRCVHMFCIDCMTKHAEARRVLNIGGVDGLTQCPFCRQPITTSELLEIDCTGSHSSDDGNAIAEGSSAVESEDTSGDMEVEPTADGSPAYSAAATTAAFEALPMEHGLVPHFDSQYVPAISLGNHLCCNRRVTDANIFSVLCQVRCHLCACNRSTSRLEKRGSEG